MLPPSPEVVARAPCTVLVGCSFFPPPVKVPPHQYKVDKAGTCKSVFLEDNLCASSPSSRKRLSTPKLCADARSCTPRSCLVYDASTSLARRSASLHITIRNTTRGRVTQNILDQNSVHPHTLAKHKTRKHFTPWSLNIGTMRPPTWQKNALLPLCAWGTTP